jgi:hypothetical protein
MVIPDPDIYPSRIPDPTKTTKEERKRHWIPGMDLPFLTLTTDEHTVDNS